MKRHEPIGWNKMEWVRALPKKPAYVDNLIARYDEDQKYIYELIDIIDDLRGARRIALQDAAKAVADAVQYVDAPSGTNFSPILNAIYALEK